MKTHIVSALAFSLFALSASAATSNIIRTTAPISFTQPDTENPPGGEVEQPGESLTIGFKGSPLTQGRFGLPYNYNFMPQLEWGSIPVDERDAPVFSTQEGIHTGLELSATGILGGTPMEGGNYQFTVKASNEHHAGQQVYELSVLDFSFDQKELASGLLGKTYNQKLPDHITWVGLLPEQTSGGIDWQLAENSDPLPQGIELDARGNLQGLPSAEGSYSFTVSADSSGLIKQKTFTLIVDGSALELLSVGAGGSHSCGVTPEKTVKCWGYNLSGQLGDASNTTKKYPVDVQGLTDVKSLSVGFQHNCALTEDGRAFCWGHGGNGRLGNGTVGSRNIPTEVSVISGQIDSISASNSHTCAIINNGDLYCWGANSAGSMGMGVTGGYTTPTKTTMPVGAKMVAAAMQNTYVVGVDGSVYAAGSNANGAMTSEYISQNSFVKLNLIAQPVASVYGSFSASTGCALLVDGQPICWGSMPGNGASYSATPVNPTGLTGVTSIVIGDGHKCALLTSGGISCWGDAENGNIGTGTSLDSAIPVSPVQELRARIKQISSGTNHLCAVYDSGAAKCWGYGGSGQLGNNSTSGSYLPSSVVPAMP